MRRIASIFLMSMFTIVIASCERAQPPTSPDPGDSITSPTTIDPAMAAGEIVLAGGWTFDPEVELPGELSRLADKNPHLLIREFEREVVVGDIVHYDLVLEVGPGEHDVIGLHRVVREQSPYRPEKARKSIFLVHGAGKDFVGSFLPGLKSPDLPDDLGFAVFMAAHGLDVWGIDCSYTLVPGDVEEFAFAEDWGMDRSVADLRTGVTVARYVRLFTGNGFRKMILLGYSQGAVMGYGLLNQEVALPRGQRSISAFMPVDFGLAWDDPELMAVECEALASWQELLDAGIYGMLDDPDGFYAAIGILARDDAGGPSPYYDGFTNLEVFLFFTAGSTPPQTSHYWAADWTEDGLPVSLTYTTLPMAADFWIYWAPMSPPTRLWVDLHSILCGDEDAVWEDQLDQLELPVFSLEAAGGFGPDMAGTLDRLVNAEVTRHVVQFFGPDDAWLDFGHVDLFTAVDAEAVAWQPALDWITGLRGQAASAQPDLASVLGPEGRLEIMALERPSYPAPSRRHDPPATTGAPTMMMPLEGLSGHR
jgi:predicted esterase